VLQILLGNQQGLAAEETELAALLRQFALHPLHVVEARHVGRVALRMLIAVQALQIADHAKRTHFDRHGCSPC
jgi:hypothetical protein